jgi:hypothetical protein
MMMKKKLIEKANENTHWKIQSKDAVIKFSLNLTNDPEKTKRLESQLCVYCFYKEGGFAGQAFSTKKCEICEDPQTYSSTDTDDLCLACAKEHKLCKHCNSHIDLKIKR